MCKKKCVKQKKKKLFVFGVFGIEHFKKRKKKVFFQEKKRQLHVMTIKL